MGTAGRVLRFFRSYSVGGRLMSQGKQAGAELFFRTGLQASGASLGRQNLQDLLAFSARGAKTPAAVWEDSEHPEKMPPFNGKDPKPKQPGQGPETVVNTPSLDREVSTLHILRKQQRIMAEEGKEADESDSQPGFWEEPGGNEVPAVEKQNQPSTLKGRSSVPDDQTQMKMAVEGLEEKAEEVESGTGKEGKGEGKGKDPSDSSSNEKTIEETETEEVKRREEALGESPGTGKEGKDPLHGEPGRQEGGYA
eukprot:TRINITY_DN32382_c0_g1_i1.p1 TRINITY_DN32382_c0_g1~~TRINITY_DN32382_c0_g1_i1.p1  ORF type:complete len:252 (-),score=59.68 TRINITY_DN32382_c0_g1_i1:668-1423(-)